MALFLSNHASPAKGGFFRYHGIWSPGVRMFRSLSFPSKAMVICALLSVPIVALGWQYYQNQSGQIGFSAQERLGVDYLRAQQTLLAQEQLAREGGDASAADTAFRALADTDARLGGALQTASHWADLQKARAAVAQAPSGAPRTAAQDAAIAAVVALGAHVVDSSNLALDPDIDTYYLMSSITMRQPELIERLHLLRRQGEAAAAAGTPEAARELAGSLAVARYLADANESELGKVLQANAEAGGRVAHKAAVDATKAFLQAVEKGSLPADAARRAVDEQRRLNGRALAVLDELIAARVQRMERSSVVVCVLSGSFMLLAAYMFFCFYKVTRGGMEEVRSHLRSMTRGDLTSSPRPWGSDEAASLMLTLAEMQASLRHIVSQVRQSSGEILHSSSEIASGAMDLSSRT